MVFFLKEPPSMKIKFVSIYEVYDMSVSILECLGGVKSSYLLSTFSVSAFLSL